MPPFKVVILKHGYPSLDIERSVIEAAGGELIDTETLAEADALRMCEDADAILVRWLRIGPELMDRFRRCRIIIRYGIGFDNVDVNAASDRGIMVGHVPTYCLDDVSTHAIALWLACARRIVSTHEKLASGRWDDNPPETIWRTAARTFGIVGLGNIGRAVARKLACWNMRLIAADPWIDPARATALGVELVDFETLCRESDYVSLHVPLLPETRHLINAESLARMKPGAILVNTARGPVVDGNALVKALNIGQIAAAGIDVFEEEPLPLEAPLRKHPRVVLSDHLAWYSEESLADLKRTVAEEAVRVCAGGLPRAVANPDVLRKLRRWDEWQVPDNVRWQLKRLAALGQGR